MLLSIQLLLIAVGAFFCYAILKICAVVRYRRYRLRCIRKLPGRKWHPSLGVISEFQSPGEDGLSFLRDLVRTYPRLSYWFFGPFHVAITVSHPESVKAILKTSEPKPVIFGAYMFLVRWLGEGLLTAKGRKWARHRRLLTPAFHFDILKPYNNINNQAVEIFMNKLETSSVNDEYFEAFSAVSLCTLEVVLKCAFSFPDDIQNEGDSHPYVNAMQSLGHLVMFRALRPWMYNPLVFYSTAKGKQFKKCIAYVHSVATDVIERRRKTLENRLEVKSTRFLDFLDILLTARDETGKGLTDREIRDEVDTFLFEGHDTTASAISWMLHSMADNPQWQRQCQHEIDGILHGRDSDEILWDDLSKMPVLTACLKENMRLHTTVPLIERETTKHMYIDGYFVPRGTTININLYGLMHNELVWDRPLKYEPERFLDEDLTRDTYAFLPFSAGPRNCIGQHFAMHEMKTIVARILRRFSLEVDPSRPARQLLSIVMRTEDGMYLKATPRTNGDTTS